MNSLVTHERKSWIELGLAFILGKSFQIITEAREGNEDRNLRSRMAVLLIPHRGEMTQFASFAEVGWLADANPSLASLASVKAVVFEFMARSVDGSDGSGIDDVVNVYSSGGGNEGASE